MKDERIFHSEFHSSSNCLSQGKLGYLPDYLKVVSTGFGLKIPPPTYIEINNFLYIISLSFAFRNIFFMYLHLDVFCSCVIFLRVLVKVSLVKIKHDLTFVNKKLKTYFSKNSLFCRIVTLTINL